MNIYTRAGDDGTTGLLYGGRVSKSSPAPTAYGDVDELQASLGTARALQTDPERSEIFLAIQRELYVLMAELAASPTARSKLVDGTTRVAPSMVTHLEELIDRFSALFEPPREFVVPGDNPLAAALDVARTVARRAERSVVALAESDPEIASPEGIASPDERSGGWPALGYLNRLSDLLWTLARCEESTSVPARVNETAPPEPTSPRNETD